MCLWQGHSVDQALLLVFKVVSEFGKLPMSQMQPLSLMCCILVVCPWETVSRPQPQKPPQVKGLCSMISQC
jgi:hypothetical protein